MDNKQQLKYRTDLITATVKREKTERVPIMSNAWNWKVYDAGYKLSDALYNTKSYTKVLKHYFDKYPTDFIFEIGNRNPFAFTQFFGSDKHYIINDDTHAMNIVDESFLLPDEYDELINDPMKFVWEKFLPRKCKNVKGEANGKVYIDGMYAFINYANAFNNNIAMLKKNYGIPFLYDLDSPFYMLNSFDIMMDFMRGIKGLSMDVRRYPQKVIAACKALDSIYEPKIEKYNGSDGHREECAFDGAMVYIAQTILSAKQFETFYLPGLKKAADFAKKHNKTVLLFTEGENSRFWDYFKELPKGHFAIVSEIDDIFEIKKALPNMCVGGGMPVDLLGKASSAKCVDYAKKLVCELGTDGGYIFTQNKMMSYPTDCKAENLKTVCDFVYNFR